MISAYYVAHLKSLKHISSWIKKKNNNSLLTKKKYRKVELKKIYS